jgi:hypothetical protein
MKSALIAASAVFVIAGFTPAASAQSREWTASGYDAQRSHWVRADPRIKQATVEDGTFRFLWKHTFHNEARHEQSLTEPVLQDFLVGYRGFKSLAFIGGSADRVFAIDTDLARHYWTTHVTYAVATAGPPPSTPECPGGLMAAVSRRTVRLPAPFVAGGASGARSKSAVGEPGKGAAVIAERAARAAAVSAGTGDAPAAAPAAAQAPASAVPARDVPGVPFGGVDPLYVMGSDGLLRTLRVTDGASMAEPIVFVPPSARPSSLLWVDGMVYTTTSGRCGGAPNAVWALDLTEAAPVARKWESGGPDIVGATGVAVGSDALIYVALPDAVVALDRITLQEKDRLTADGARFNASPTVIRHKGRDLVAVAAGDGRLYLLDGASLGGADHKTPMHVVEAGADRGAGLATWEDGTTRWVLAPSSGANEGGAGIVAFTIVDRGTSFALERAWRSRTSASPLAPIVVNGVVFAASSTPAVLHAFEGATGRELWSSGATITSPARAGLSAGGGQVYVVTQDNTLYAFGIPLEH